MITVDLCVAGNMVLPVIKWCLKTLPENSWGLKSAKEMYDYKPSQLYISQEYSWQQIEKLYKTRRLTYLICKSNQRKDYNVAMRLVFENASDAMRVKLIYG